MSSFKRFWKTGNNKLQKDNINKNKKKIISHITSNVYSNEYGIVNSKHIASHALFRYITVYKLRILKDESFIKCASNCFDITH